MMKTLVCYRINDARILDRHLLVRDRYDIPLLAIENLGASLPPPRPPRPFGDRHAARLALALFGVFAR